VRSGWPDRLKSHVSVAAQEAPVILVVKSTGNARD
jgi:hypothetical protein